MDSPSSVTVSVALHVNPSLEIIYPLSGVSVTVPVNHPLSFFVSPLAVTPVIGMASHCAVNVYVVSVVIALCASVPIVTVPF